MRAAAANEKSSQGSERGNVWGSSCVTVTLFDKRHERKQTANGELGGKKRDRAQSRIEEKGRAEKRKRDEKEKEADEG